MSKKTPVHNNFFLKTFKDAVNTKDFIMGTLPPGIVKRLDFSTLKIEDSCHIDERLRSHLSDFIIKIKTKDEEPVDLYFLF